MVASVSVPDSVGHIDELKLTRPRNSCWGSRKKVLASFTFPHGGWRPLATSVLVNSSCSHAAVKQESLGRRSTSTPVRVECLAEGCPVLRASLSLGSLLEGLKNTRDGNTSSLFFTLAVGGQRGLVLCCNGFACSTDAVHPRHQQSLLKGEEDREGDAQSSPEAEGAHEGVEGNGPSAAEAEKDSSHGKDSYCGENSTDGEVEDSSDGEDSSKRKDSPDGEDFSDVEKKESSDGEKDSYDREDSSKEEKEESSNGENSFDWENFTVWEREEDADSYPEILRGDLTEWLRMRQLSPLSPSPRTPHPSQEGVHQQEFSEGEKDSSDGEEDADSYPEILRGDLTEWLRMRQLSPLSPSPRTPNTGQEEEEQQQELRHRRPETPARMETVASSAPRGTAANTWLDVALDTVVVVAIMVAQPLLLLELLTVFRYMGTL